jgi:signal transduction histidine kinase
MNQFFGQVFSFLTVAPGNLVYHLVLVFSLAGALLGAITLWRSSEFPQARRTVIGLAILLALQLLEFLIGALAWQGVLSSLALLPPLDRAITLWSLIWVVWLWAFPEPLRLADAAAALLSLLVVPVFGLTLFVWAPNSNTLVFSQSLLDMFWQLASIGVIVLGAAILIIRQPNGWGQGLGFLGLVFVGHLIYLIPPVPQSNFPGAVRLMQLAAYPILLTLPQRFPMPTTRAASRPPLAQAPKREEEQATTGETRVERRRYSTDPKTFHALLALAAELEDDGIARALTRATAQAMLADLCFLLTLDGKQGLLIVCGYDLIREEGLGGTTLDVETVPLLASAVQRGRPLRLPASSTSTDLKGLGQVLGLSTPGHLLSVPIPGDKTPLGALLLLSPYSNRLWSAEDQAYLTNVASLFAPILKRGQRVAELEQEREAALSQVKDALDRAAVAEKKYEDLLGQFEAARQQLVEQQVQADNVAALLAAQEEAQQLIEQLRAENEQLREGLMPEYASAAQLEQDLRASLEDVARLQNALAEANMKILELEKRTSAPIGEEQIEVIASIAQELRQPLSSIVGYTDLLLGESVGILGTLQRKFLERIKAATERVSALIEDLIQVAAIETVRLNIKPEPIDLTLIVDNAMAYVSNQIREKNITLRLDLPDPQTQVQTDREALQQILIHLLQNASGATPADGTVSLRIQTQREGDQDYLLIQVADTGGGIPAENLPHVFARRYRADNALIPGLGDTGVGLSIAKTLAEAQHGRIWVDTEAGVGSTFSVLLPVEIQRVSEEGK